MTFRTYLSAVALLCWCPAAAQQAADDAGKRQIGIMARAETGMIANTNDFLDGVNAAGKRMKNFSAYTIGAEWQTRGGKTWEHVHNFPSFGVALYTASLDNKEEIGQPVSLFGFYRGTFWRGQRASLRYNIDMGLAANWDCYDKRTNPYNITIGSPVTVHLGFGIEYTYTIGKQFVIGAGVGATHFSNGAMRKPNKGLNLLSPQVRLAYMLKPYDLPERRTDYGRPKAHEIALTVGMGLKRYECDTVAHPELNGEYQMGAKYHVVSLQTTYLRRYGHKGKFGGGLSLNYDTWLGSSLKVNGPDDVEPILGETGKRFTLGVFATHELCIDRLCVVTQLGAYVLKPKGIEQTKPDLFERAGLKYLLPLDFFVGVNIYAHNFTKAEFIEWNIGYTIPIKKQKL